MAAQGSSRVAIFAALIGNALVALTKFIAAAITGSAAMLAEGVHSVVDTGNQVLLLYGLKRAKLPPDERFPFGHGKEVYFWSFVVAILIFGLGAGFSIYEGVVHLIAPAKIRVEITDQGINIGGYLVKRRSERYRNPQTGVMTPVIADGVVKMIAKDAGHKLIYCALDDLDANLQALPFFSKPLKSDDPSGYKIIGESKPLPVVNPKGICDATVI